jgi:LacI family transcriptional regulator
MADGRRASLQEVADRLGLSAATVSRAINGDPRVRPATAAAVQRVAAELDYQPPDPSDRRRSRARALQGRHLGRLALLIPDTNVEALGTTLSGRLLHGMMEALTADGLVLSVTGLPQPETLPALLDRRQIDGVLVRAGYRTAPWLPAALAGLPHVWVFASEGPDDGADRIVPDNAALASLAAEWLLARGRRLAVCNEWPHHLELVARAVAFCQQVLAAGAEPPRVLAGPGDLTPEIDGVFLPGAGPLPEFHRAGAGRLAIAVCSNEPAVVEAFDPPPANLDIQPEAIGRAAAETLLWRLAHPDEPARRVLVAPRLVAAV